MVVDGNSGAGRLLPTLCSGSLTMLASLVQEWYHFKLQVGGTASLCALLTLVCLPAQAAGSLCA